MAISVLSAGAVAGPNVLEAEALTVESKLVLFPPSVHTLVDSRGLPFSGEQCPSKSG